MTSIPTDEHAELRKAIAFMDKHVFQKVYRNADYLAMNLGAFRKMVKEKFPDDEAARQFLNNLPPGIGDDGIVLIDKNGLRLLIDNEPEK
jgi:hypothetical protein